MTLHTDPTYLRTIVDGLNFGALQKDNPSSLPQGLVGVYEEAIPPASQVNERRKFLEFFGVWALMKKEVSADFVVSMLDGWKEADVLAFIGRYSKWFNSPVSGVYTIYHERFRTFLLQKISGSQLRDINNRVIKACNEALTRRLNDEWERYALEYLSAHLLQPSLDTIERGGELKALAYNTNHWNRQIEVSKDFDWSKRLLNDMMLWASKYDDDEVIECALNKVDLQHLEHNDASRIVELVAQNDIETALLRIENLTGNDMIWQHKFQVYLTCLDALRFSIRHDFAKKYKGALSIINHLDGHLPIDFSMLDWGVMRLKRSFDMFELACWLSEIGCPYTPLFTRTSGFWNTEWKVPIDRMPKNHIDVALECAKVSRHYVGLCKFAKCFSDYEMTDAAANAMSLVKYLADSESDIYQSLLIRVELSKTYSLIGQSQGCEDTIRQSYSLVQQCEQPYQRAMILAAMSAVANAVEIPETAAEWKLEAISITEQFDVSFRDFANKEIENTIEGQDTFFSTFLALAQEEDEHITEAPSFELDEVTKKELLVELTRRVAESNQINLSSHLVNSLEEGVYRSFAMHNRAIGCFKSDPDRVENLLDDIPQGHFGVYYALKAHARIGTMLYEAGNVESSANMFNKGIELLLLVTDDYERRACIAEMIQAACDRRDFLWALDKVQTLKESQVQAYCFSLISIAYYKLGELVESDEYLHRAEMIAKDMIRDTEYSGWDAVASIYCIRRDWIQTENTIQKLSVNRKRQKAMGNCADWMLRSFGYLEAMRFSLEFSNDEMRIRMRNAISRQFILSHFSSTDVISELKCSLLCNSNLELCLYALAINRLFIEDVTEEEFSRLTQTLNLQWAIDIKNSFIAN